MRARSAGQGPRAHRPVQGPRAAFRSAAPALGAAVRANIVLGNFESACCAAMKAVEVAVRDASGVDNALGGVKLMRAAFQPHQTARSVARSPEPGHEGRGLEAASRRPTSASTSTSRSRRPTSRGPAPNESTASRQGRGARALDACVRLSSRRSCSTSRPSDCPRPHRCSPTRTSIAEHRHPAGRCR
ncbi:TIGR02391 family protein [Streptomyces sp. NPDC001970]